MSGKTNSPTTNPGNRELIRKNARTGLAVLGAVLLMTGLSFASVPLYGLFCRVTGFGGTTQVSRTLPSTVLERTVAIRFNADTGRDMNWEFRPEQRQVTVRLGERGLTAFHAKNEAARTVGGTALYNVIPAKAGKYFNKIQCFCFDEQFLKAGEEASFPVMFFVDPAMDKDPDMDDVKTITLSYTFYEAESKALDDALEKFYGN